MKKQLSQIGGWVLLGVSAVFAAAVGVSLLADGVFIVFAGIAAMAAFWIAVAVIALPLAVVREFARGLAQAPIAAATPLAFLVGGVLSIVFGVATYSDKSLCDGTSALSLKETFGRCETPFAGELPGSILVGLGLAYLAASFFLLDDSAEWTQDPERRTSATRRSLLALLGAAAVTVPAGALGFIPAESHGRDRPEPVIDWTQADARVGDTLTVKGPVVSAHYASQSTGSPTFINIGGDVLSENRFTVVIWGDDRSGFPTAPEVLYGSGTVCVTGEISEFKGIPQIVVTRPTAVRTC